MPASLCLSFLLFVVLTGTTAKQCYQCAACPKPFKRDAPGVSKIDVGDDEYCRKSIMLFVNAENRDAGGYDCRSFDQYVYCCKGNLCNGAPTATPVPARVFSIVALLLLISYSSCCSTQ